MKLDMIKAYVPALALALALGMTSCVNDLDVDPINPQQTMELDNDALFNKIYASFSLTGQQGPSDQGDVADIDEGSSAFYRMGWYLNEFTTDEASWVWASDAGVPDLLHNTYGASNDFSTGMYYRLYFTITLCNFYLQNVSAESDEMRTRIAEVRLIRAINYMYVMDLYGNAAFITTVGADLAEYYTRQEFYDFVESELLDVEDDLASAGTNTYGRLDKVADWMLLARLYLNAEVYTGTAQWEKAKTYAKQVIDNGYYHLCTTGAVHPSTGEVFSAYQMLFMADNDTNGAQYEAIFPVLCDGDMTSSYGNSTFLVLGCYGSAEDLAVPSGTDCSWGKCVRVRRQLLDKFFSTNGDGTSAIPETDNLQEIIGAAGDDRALFYTLGYTADTPDESDSNAGESCVKFRSYRTDGGERSSALYMSDMDIPFLRVAEAYLTYAEADARINGGNTTSTGAEMINALRNRANASTQSSYSLSYILDEWSREFWMEGRRRTDLVRFGYYGGQASYKWEWMGGTYEGSQFSSNRNIFAIPENDLSNNSNLVQNPGY